MEFVKTLTEDKLILQGLIAEPNKKSDTAILHIHGMAGNFWENSFIKTMIEEYPKNGYTFLTVETRGSELMRWFNTEDEKQVLLGNAHEIFEDCIYDIDAWINFLKYKGYKKIHLQGHSLGCSKIAYFKILNNDKTIKSLILISPSDMLGLALNEKGLPKHNKLLSEAQTAIKKGEKDKLLDFFWDFALLSAKTYVNFFDKNAKTAIFNYYKPSLGFKTLEKINIPMLSIFGTNDDGIVTDPYESNNLIEKKAINCPKFTGQVIKGAQHDYEGFEKDVVNIVLAFLRKD
ncbi:MAG: DUF1749 domain-containing protein [Nanoarchaeota archaeon]|nr:DUF1749 domain-containing protein [Nanoarchaeota archaeon]